MAGLFRTLASLEILDPLAARSASRRAWLTLNIPSASAANRYLALAWLEMRGPFAVPNASPRTWLTSNIKSVAFVAFRPHILMLRAILGNSAPSILLKSASRKPDG